jgi:hypothetical protein
MVVDVAWGLSNVDHIHNHTTIGSSPMAVLLLLPPPLLLPLPQVVPATPTSTPGGRSRLGSPSSTFWDPAAAVLLPLPLPLHMLPTERRAGRAWWCLSRPRLLLLLALAWPTDMHIWPTTAAPMPWWLMSKMGWRWCTSSQVSTGSQLNCEAQDVQTSAQTQPHTDFSLLTHIGGALGHTDISFVIICHAGDGTG